MIKIDKDQVFDFEYNGVTYYYNRIDRADKIAMNTNDNKLEFYGLYKCKRCGGTGLVPLQKSNGICYYCHGIGYSKIKLNTTKNKVTAEKRAQIKNDERLNILEVRDKAIRDNNLKNTLKMYTDKFYLILDKLGEKTTYETRDYLKSLGARWNSDFECWWISKNKVKDFDKYTFIEISTEDYLNNYNRINEQKVANIVVEYKRALEEAKMKPIEG